MVFETRIQASCQVTTAVQQCTFTNTGDVTGSGCAVVTLTNTEGVAIESAKVCSGELKAAASVVQPVVYTGTQPAAICPHLSVCHLGVAMSDVQQTGAAQLVGVLPLLVVIASSVWVYSDAKRIRAGQSSGTSPGAWLAACLLLWIVAFPVYLISRAKIKRASFQPSPGLRCGVVWSDGQSYDAQLLQTNGEQWLVQLARGGEPVWVPSDAIRPAR